MKRRVNRELAAREMAKFRESEISLGEKLDLLVVGTANLLSVSESHERRLTRIEGASE
jgi:hypothetical protein